MAELLRGFADARGSAPALVDDLGTQSWESTNARVNRLINAFSELGVGPGDHVCLMARNSAPWWEITLACVHVGIICTPVNWHWQHEELAYVLSDARAKVLFVGSEFLPVARRGLDRSDVDCRVVALGDVGGTAWSAALGYEEVLDASGDAEPTTARFGTRPMMYTSGTTGRPKGVLSQAGLGEAHEIGLGARGFAAMMGIEPGSPTLIAGPAYHSAQWSFALLPFLCGGPLVTPSATGADAILGLIDDYAIANVHLVPTQFVRLLRLDEQARASFSGASLRVVAHGGAPCPPQVKRQMIDWWGEVIVEYYGGTETGMVSKITAKEWLDHEGSVGLPIPGAQVDILDASTGQPCPPGSAGVIWVRREGSDFEYYGDQDKTATAHDHRGFGSTGDVGYVDGDGYLYVSDRIADLVISGGVNIYPAQVEGVLQEHDAVEDVAVLGLPDDEFGERVVAVVTLVPGADADDVPAELSAYCRSRLASYMCPREFHVVDAVARSAAGKLLKRQIRHAILSGAIGNGGNQR